MKASVNFELTPQEFEVLKKSLINYRGKLIHRRNNFDIGYEEMKKLERELKTTNTMINEFITED